jgi:hypothetical protein
MGRGRPPKEFHEYLTKSKGTLPKVSLDEYVDSPATAFLRYCVQAHYSVLYCIRYFPSTDVGAGRLEHISSGLLPAIMGHFETYQKYLFSGVFEHSNLLKTFDVHKFFRKLERDYGLGIDPVRLAAYRGFSATSGLVLADNLSGWHDPERVNAYFGALLNATPFDETSTRRIRVLWQLRHSIVHTGGSITLPDAQKVEDLSPFADKLIVFEKNFISEVSRKFHPMVFQATESVQKTFFGQMIDNPTDAARKRLDKLFLIKSPINAWLP